MTTGTPNSEIAERAARLVPDLLLLAEESALTAIQNLQWVKHAPSGKLLSKVRLEVLAFAFFLLDFLVFGRLGPELRDLFMDDLMLLALHRLTEGMDDNDASAYRKSFVEVANVYSALYSKYEKVLVGPNETPDGSALWWYSVYLTQTIKGHALNRRHLSKTLKNAFAFTSSLDTLLTKTLAMPLESTK
jgi:hypothetical protein